MSRLEKLYQEMILEHNKNPRNFGVIENAQCDIHGKNPLCGDDYHLFVNFKDDSIDDIKFEGSGCAISKSSGSLMTQTLKGKSKEEATEVKDQFLDLLMKDTDIVGDKLGKLKVFEGVKKYPVRVKCATLIWRALESALAQNQNEVTTE